MFAFEQMLKSPAGSVLLKADLFTHASFAFQLTGVYKDVY